MAIYLMSVKNISAGNGAGIVAAVAYRSKERIADEKTGEIHDYRGGAGDLLHSELILPADAPAEFSDRAKLVNSVRQNEKRKDARYAREFLVSLPRELPPNENMNLVYEFVSRFTSNGRAADVAYHCPTASDGGEQPHAHIIVYDRQLTAAGFAAKKDRAWNSVEYLQQCRDDWAEIVNEGLERSGVNAYVSAESNAARGIAQQPQQKMRPSRRRAGDTAAPVREWTAAEVELLRIADQEEAAITEAWDIADGYDANKDYAAAAAVFDWIKDRLSAVCDSVYEQFAPSVDNAQEWYHSKQQTQKEL